MAEDLRAAAVVQQQRREEAYESRLARAILAENRDGLAAGHVEGHTVQCGDPPPPWTRRCAGSLAPKLLAQLDDFDCGDGCEGLRRRLEGGLRLRHG
jgi:hypothetical protein